MENENFSLFCSKIDALAILPIDDVPAGMDYIKSIMPDEARELVNYFDQTYISGINRPIGISRPGKKTKFRNITPIFPPATWNVHETTIKNLERTNNRTEGFNHRFSKLVSYNHPSIWTLIKKIRLKIDSDSTKITQFDIGNLQPKKKKIYI
ncbi:MULE domain-containing protein [Aphis craccivora]|uniref:MULE domain-containing protein n=1 Tax=Aphis craccivora TaxID=307492 RepID=A0A6G0VQ27_APHCR|nr:MULE domain-containing protein [Aphis craccivora]